MEQHDPEKCGTCAVCLFEKSIKEWESKKRYRVLDTKQFFTVDVNLNYLGNHIDQTAQKIEDAINALDKEGYEMIAVDTGMVYFRLIPPQLPQGMQILKPSDLKEVLKGKGQGTGGDGFSDEDIGEPIK